MIFVSPFIINSLYTDLGTPGKMQVIQLADIVCQGYYNPGCSLFGSIKDKFSISLSAPKCL